ncbi:MAG: serine hydrolase [Bacteroidota bacterium]
MLRYLLLLICSVIGFSTQAQKNPLEQLIALSGHPLDTIFSQPEKYQAQLIYTQIDRDENNVPTFTSYQLGVDDNRYYYPASTVKMPAAFMALEKLNELSINGLDKEATIFHGAAREPQTTALVDPTAENQLPSIAHYIKKIFVVSDNDAYNRLYEFLGQKYFNEQLLAKGFEDTRIIHRLSVSGFDVEGNRHTNPVSFVEDNELLYYQGARYTTDERKWSLKDQVRGVARMTNDGEIVDEPFDFSTKNYIALYDLHDLLKVILFPESVAASRRFNLTEADYDFLYRVMSTQPKESQHPDYSDLADNYVKFFMANDSIPDHIRVFNKVGWAYGFLTDASYIVDFEKGIEYFLCAAIHVNENQTYNDGVYEYESVGLPYFGKIGELIYEYEVKRKRAFKPDLKRFLVERYE